MGDEMEAEARAKRLRDRIARAKTPRSDGQQDTTDCDPGPAPGESPHAYVERRMRETLKKNDE